MKFDYTSYKISAHFSVKLCRIFVLKHLKNTRISAHFSVFQRSQLIAYIILAH